MARQLLPEESLTPSQKAADKTILPSNLQEAVDEPFQHTLRLCSSPSIYIANLDNIFLKKTGLIRL